MKKYLKVFVLFCLLCIVLCTLFASMVFNGTIILNAYQSNQFDVKGIDVSHYQGRIDWDVLASQNISFAFIKATEGSSFVDPNFTDNFAEAGKTSLAVGAYHFFSYDSSGQTQAENFINTIIPFEGMLPPVIDVEFYGDKEKNPPTREQVSEQLKVMLDLLEEHYHQKPILYATGKSYELFLSNDYEEYDIWIRNVFTKPKLSDGRQWVFWQYTDHDQLDGYHGKEKYIDVNVFYGDQEQYMEYLKNRTYQG